MEYLKFSDNYLMVSGNKLKLMKKNGYNLKLSRHLFANKPVDA